MKTFTTNAYGIYDAPELLERRPDSVLRAVRHTWLENNGRLNIEVGQHHQLGPKSWIIQFIAPEANPFDEIVPCFVTAVVNAGDSYRSFYFGSLDIVCPGLSGMYQTRIIDDYPKIGFWVDRAVPSFDCRFTNPDKTEMEIETTLFLLPKPGEPKISFKKPLKKFRIAKVSGGVDWWLP